MDLTACLEDAARSQALFCWNINIAASNPQQARLRRALSREDLFTVAIDLFGTDVGSGEAAAVAATSARPSEPLVQFSRKRLSLD
jgi:hypothetical protein